MHRHVRYNGLGVGVGYGGGYGGYGGGYGSYGYGSPLWRLLRLQLRLSQLGGYGSGYGYGSPYYGWYDNYYYPGTGYYVYDSYRRPHSMTPIQKAYWSKRSPHDDHALDDHDVARQAELERLQSPIPVSARRPADAREARRQARDR